MNQTERSPIVMPLAVIVVTVLVILAGLNIAKLNQVARDSAHSALWHEIQQQLKAREATGQFPADLSELTLTYPDGGSPEMLKLFEYRSDGTACKVATTIRGVRKTASFGDASP